ncbi:MAG: acyltransferase [Bacteriovoracaceae bacterium]|nr:acyltransferase [Bacteriovoracaceae bacterium]
MNVNSLKRNQGLDLLRFFAILMVLLLHSSQAIPEIPQSISRLFSYGWIGVDLFFVLSGFLIANQVFSLNSTMGVIQGLKTFWIKRWFRTFPLYFLVLFVYLFIKPYFGFPFNDWNYSFLVFFQNYFNLNDFVQSWSLCIEEQFYILFPIVFFVFGVKSNNLKIWCLPVLMSVIARFFIWKSGAMNSANEIVLSSLVRFPFHTHLDGISAGVLLAASFKSWEKISTGSRKVLAILGLSLLFVSLGISGPDIYGFNIVFLYSILALAFSFLLISTYSIRIPDFIFMPIHKIALWSYGLYLWNNLFIRVFLKWDLSIHWLLKLIIFFILNLIISAITYYGVEKVFLIYRDKVLARLAFEKKASN